MHPLHQICRWLGETTPLQSPERCIRHLLIDSRQVVQAGETLFFALAGERTDGHAYVRELYQKGVRAFVVKKRVSACPDADFIELPQVSDALQIVAAKHRQTFSIPIVGITGSNGKTIVKEWLVQVLTQLGVSVAASPRSYNSQIGVPLSLWRLQASHQLGVFEAGISQAGEMGRLASLIQPTLGLFTNLGDAHAAGFTSSSHKLQEKLSLFKGVSELIYRADDAAVTKAVSSLAVPSLSWATHSEADVAVQLLESGRGYQRIRLTFPAREIHIQIPFSDAVAFENAVHLACCLYALGQLSDESIPLFAGLRPVAQRMELMAGRQQCTILNDSYTNDLTALGLALNFAHEQRRAQTITLILSDILQAGLPPNELYRRTAVLVGDRIDRLIGVGPSVSLLQQYLPATLPQHYFATTTDLLDVLPDLRLTDTFILLKGARSFGFERLLFSLKKRTHPTILEVDLSAILHNVRQFQQRLLPQTGIAAMVKAAAYGSGSLEVARKLEVAGVQHLVVAYPDEGIQLRQGGIQAPIIVLNVPADALLSLWSYRLEPEVYDRSQLVALATLGEGQQQKLPLHIKINTGMNRLGFDLSEIEYLAEYLVHHPILEVASVFSHLAAADDPAADDFTHQQALHFETAYAQLCQALGYWPRRHLLNTSGIARFPQYQYDLVRLGLGLYGLESSGTMSVLLQTVLYLKTTISQIRKLSANQTIGYGRKGRLPTAGRIATIGIGYADGLPRSAGHGRYHLSVNGHLVPTVGAICMDMCMLDVSEVPGLQVGDEVIVFGIRPGIEDLSAVDGTISYEMLTRISERVPRRYIQE